MPTEAECEQSPDVRAARALLETRLRRLTPSERAAFWEAVERCYASEPEADAEAAQAAA